MTKLSSNSGLIIEKKQCNGEVIDNQYIAPRDLKVKFNSELSFIYSSYSMYFIMFSYNILGIENIG